MTDTDNWKWSHRPKTAAEFDAMMQSLDAHLASYGLLPFQRGLEAARLVSMRLGLSGTGIVPLPEQRTAPYGAADLLGRVHDWYVANYGERMAVDFSPGHFVIELRGTLWRVHLPRVWGTVKIFIDRNLANAGRQLGRDEPASINLLSLVEDLSRDFAAALNDVELNTIADTFKRAWPGLCWLDEQKGNLFSQARSDHKLAVEALVKGCALAKARWDFAQCAEKTLKGLLEKANVPYPKGGSKGHDIPYLGKLVADTYGNPLPSGDLQDVHCSPSVRYGEVATTANEALRAHDALIRVLGLLAKLPPQGGAGGGKSAAGSPA